MDAFYFYRNNGVRRVKRGVILGNMVYQRGNRALMVLKKNKLLSYNSHCLDANVVKV